MVEEVVAIPSQDDAVIKCARVDKNQIYATLKITNFLFCASPSFPSTLILKTVFVIILNFPF